MNKFKNNRIILLIFSFLIIGQVYSAFTPKKDVSNIDKCYYKIEGKTSSWTSFIKDWFEVSCKETLNFSSLPNNIGNIPDGTYYLNFKGFDKNQIGDIKAFDSESSTTYSNKYGIQTFGPYKIDTSAPKCLLKEIRFKEGESDNQYYNNGKFYYKKANDAKGKFELIIESDDTINGTNTSGIKEIQFPSILGNSPTTQSFSSHTGKVLVSGLYNWSGDHNDTFDILNNNSKKFCFDNAGNTSFLSSDSNTKVIFEDGNHILTGLSNLILTPDSNVPTVNGITLDNLTNGFKFKSGNHGEGSELSIYSGSTDTKFFAAFTGRTLIIPKFLDDGAGLKSFKIGIEKYDDSNNFVFYTKTGSTKDVRLTSLTDLNTIHDFRNVYNDFNVNKGYRNYGWSIQTLNLAGNKVKEDYICDMVGNCVPVMTPDFKVVANNPYISDLSDDYCLGTNNSKGTKHTLNSTCKKYDGNNNNMRSNFFDTHSTIINFTDEYGNPILPVSGVKKIKLEINFDNSMGCNQISTSDREKGDCINFVFKNNTSQLAGNSHLVNEYKNFGFNLTEANQFVNGQIIIELKSAIPSINEYIFKGTTKSLYGSGFNVGLQLKKLNISVTDLTNHKGVGENSLLELATPGNEPIYKWNPVINFDYVSNIYPLVEGQQKELNINSEVKDNSRVISYELNTIYGTNNFFLHFNNIALYNGNVKFGTDVYDIIGSGSYNGISGFYGRIYKDNTQYTGSGTEITIPKTIGGISDNGTKIAYFSNLNYYIENAPGLISLPSIQTGFNNFGIHEIGDFASSGNYSSDSDITFGEIDVRGITQTNNQSGFASGTGAVTTSNSTFVDFSNIKLYDIKTEISKNVEKLLAGKNRNDGCVNTSCSEGDFILDNFSNFSLSSKGINLQNGQVLYFKNSNVIISCGGTCDISGKKTLIIENGNLIIKSDMKYANNNSVLGIVLIGNKYNGSKSQVRISENITNGVGIIYSDGPIVSVNSSNIQYDGGNTGNINLVNQLYWKGSFATKNTVGGSIKDGKGVCPYGTPEYQNSSTCTIERAQGYDLIYLRRYARVNKSLYGISNDPMGDGKVPINLDKTSIKIAGGGNFIKSGNIVNKTAGNLLPPENYSSSEKARNSPLIIEYDNSLQTNPPIGFNK